MRDILKEAALVIGLVLVTLGIVAAFQGADFFLYRWYAPKYEQARRETFEQSKAYNQGMVQEIQNMAFEYAKADPAHQAALASIILHRVADYPLEKLPTHLQQFVTKLRAERLEGIK